MSQSQLLTGANISQAMKQVGSTGAPQKCFKVRATTHLKASAAQVEWGPLAAGWVSVAACSEVAGRTGCEVPCRHLQERGGRQLPTMGNKLKSMGSKSTLSPSGLTL